MAATGWPSFSPREFDPKFRFLAASVEHFPRRHCLGGGPRRARSLSPAAAAREAFCSCSAPRSLRVLGSLAGGTLASLLALCLAPGGREAHCLSFFSSRLFAASRIQEMTYRSHEMNHLSHLVMYQALLLGVVSSSLVLLAQRVVLLLQQAFRGLANTRDDL